MTVDRDTARRLAADAVAESYGDLDVRLRDELTEEGAFGWIFAYDSAAYLDTGDVRQALIGNSPVLVDREGGVHWLPTGIPLDEIVAQLEAATG